MKVTLDSEHAEKLSRMAQRAQAPEEELAQLLLSEALDDAELDGERMTEILDGIPGAFERAEEGRKQIESGDTIPLSDLSGKG